MGMVYRTLECAFSHRWKELAERGAPAPGACPVCEAIVQAIDLPSAPAPARSDVIPAPGIRGERTKAIARFEQHAFKRPHFDDGKPLLTNLKDNVREGESYAVPETPSTNETMKMMYEQQERQPVGANPTPWGFQPVSGSILGATGAPQNPMGRPVVDIKSAKRA